ncbi:hypothetical protein ACLOJK_037522 [Asimina triloba]
MVRGLRREGETRSQRQGAAGSDDRGLHLVAGKEISLPKTRFAEEGRSKAREGKGREEQRYEREGERENGREGKGKNDVVRGKGKGRTAEKGKGRMARKGKERTACEKGKRWVP